MSEVWYQAGLSFQCTGCGNCCSGPQTGFVWVSDQEIAAIAEKMNMGDDIDRFERQFVRTIGNRKSLVEYSDGDCIFLDPTLRQCSVYETRPIQCRTWPFWKENLASPTQWGQAAKSCPGCNRGKLYSLTQIEKILANSDQAASE
ncbi:MAG: YkgJ family cysteine cluster protein [Pirellula sp.]